MAVFIHPATRLKLGGSGQAWTQLHHSFANECTRLFVGPDVLVPTLLYFASYTYDLTLLNNCAIIICNDSVIDDSLTVEGICTLQQILCPSIIVCYGENANVVCHDNGERQYNIEVILHALDR
jgi:hypothetical protein